MQPPHEFVLGEFTRTLDERFRLSVPTELAEPLAAAGAECILVKERPGCLSLWPAEIWRRQLAAGIAVVESKIRAGKLQDQLEEVQTLGRMLSTRHRTVQLAGRGRLSIPEGFREFLGVEPGSDAVVVGAAVCVEIWQPAAWVAHLESRLPEFGRLFSQLTS